GRICLLTTSVMRLISPERIDLSARIVSSTWVVTVLIMTSGELVSTPPAFVWANAAPANERSIAKRGIRKNFFIVNPDIEETLRLEPRRIVQVQPASCTARQDSCHTASQDSCRSVTATS